MQKTLALVLLSTLVPAAACRPVGEDPTPTPEPGYDLYACGWEKRDPGDIVSTGNQEGNVISNFTATDQCGEDYKIWDGYGAYTIVYSLAAW